MGTNSRQKPTNLSKTYNFFQLLRILEQTQLPTAISATTNNKNLKLISTKEIGFPTTDIKNYSINKDKATVQLTFLGLCGADSPLPHYFSEYIQQNDENNCLYDFLNIFNNRLYILLYLAWKKYRPFINTEQSVYAKYLRAFAGNNQYPQELASAGLWSGKHHNCASLESLLTDYLNQTPVQIQQFVPCWVNLESLLPLGISKICIGDNAILGTRALTHKIIITIGPLTAQQMQQLTPDKPLYKKLVDLISSYIEPHIIFDIMLLFNSSNILPILGQKTIKIGHTALAIMQPNVVAFRSKSQLS